MKPIRPKTYDIQEPNLKRWRENLYKLFSRNISYGHTVDGKDQNIDGKMVEISDTGLANTNLTITHNLMRVPLYIDIKYKSIAGDWQDSNPTVAWTKTQITIQFTTAHMHVRLFIH